MLGKSILGGVPQYNSNGEQVGEVSSGGDNPNLPEGCVWVRGDDGQPIGAIAKPAPESGPETVTINGKAYVYEVEDNGEIKSMVPKDRIPDDAVPIYNQNGDVVNATPVSGSAISSTGDNPDPPDGYVWVRGDDGKPIGAIAKPAPESEPETVTINGNSYTY